MSSPGRGAGDGYGTPWPELMDALEERTRRLATYVAAGGGEPVPDVDLIPDGPLPRHMAPRVEALLAETRRLQVEAERRTTQVERARRYAQQ